MRADLDTLRIHDLPAEERDEVVGDLARAQRRVEAIITALGQLASGQLAQAEDRELIDVTDMLDRVARENGRVGSRSDAVEIVVQSDEALGTIWGWPGGLRLAVDNLVRNAVAHGGATRIVLTAHRHPSADGSGEALSIVVDDDGRGLPAEEHEFVMGRFARGSTAAAGRIRPRAGAGRAAGGPARRWHRIVRRPARRPARDADRVDGAGTGTSRSRPNPSGGSSAASQGPGAEAPTE